MEYIVNNGFSCDRQSKYDFTASTVSFLSEWVGDKDCKVMFMEQDKNGNLVEFDSADSYEKSRTDLYMFFNGHKYVIELKERWGKYTSNYYGNEGDENGWFLNIEKYEVLKKLDAIPLFVNLFPDGIVRIWNLNKIDGFKAVTKNIHQTTVTNSKLIEQQRYELWNKDATTIKRIKGEKSNGVWQS